ncbi:helix-turn-helix domain-containing protein [Solihabitans fulvus]|uniref:Helix-turn-helix domain-containing protein n=1 Tax=Solihabitans fulvus TaxID=1892852 RepID=A0A5B2WEP8_9PSEU|nr:helix-turn-helix transcriptional regulator [Solihabitans fulvus]KAA2248689.1 helix-turn-helix domain-containing protein [Solihabitans fulvus]
MKEPTNKLSATLRQMRKAAGLSGAEAARRAGLSQPKVSRTETGAFMPTPEQVEALLRAYKAPTAVRRELVQMARELREERISARVVLERGGWWLQERIGRIEEVAGRIRCLAPTGVPGLLQTGPYTRALFGESLPPDDLERTVEARMTRGRLLDTDREFEFVITEGALRWNMGGAEVMAEQLDALVAASRRENVLLGVVPWTTPVTVPLLHAFDLYDSRAVMFGTQTATALITDPREVEDYESHWAELEPFVSFGDQARAAIDRIAAEYRLVT